MEEGWKLGNQGTAGWIALSADPQTDLDRENRKTRVSKEYIFTDYQSTDAQIRRTGKTSTQECGKRKLHCSLGKWSKRGNYSDDPSDKNQTSIDNKQVFFLFFFLSVSSRRKLQISRGSKKRVRVSKIRNSFLIKNHVVWRTSLSTKPVTSGHFAITSR